jgi:hypothetical protein
VPGWSLALPGKRYDSFLRYLRGLEQFLETYILLHQRTAWIVRQGEPMHTLNLSQSDIIAYDGTPVRLVYNPKADMLEIFFGTNELATGIALTEHIVLRLNLQTKRAVSLLLLDFSILTERTEYGPRSYPLTRLHELPEEVRAVVLQVVTSMLVQQFLKVSHLQVSPTESVPLTYVEAQPSVPVA